MTYYKQSLSDLAHIAEEANSAFERIVFPAGSYQAILVKAFEKMAKTTHVKYYRFQFKLIEEGEYENKTFFHNLFFNSSPKAKDYAQRVLKQMMIATGRDEITELEDMANIPLTLHISIRGDGDEKENGLWGIGKSLHTKDPIKDHTKDNIENYFGEANSVYSTKKDTGFTIDDDSIPF